MVVCMCRSQRRFDGDALYVVISSLPRLKQVNLYKESAEQMLRRVDLRRFADLMSKHHPHVAVKPITNHRVSGTDTPHPANM